MTQAEWIAAYPELCECTMISGPTFFLMHTYEQTSLLRTLESDDIAGITVLYPPDYPSTTGGGAGGGCFIATACFGSPLAEEVRVLSDFRDRCLMRNSLGRTFVRGYYRVSPPLAEFISESPMLRFLVRTQLRPWVRIAGVIAESEIASSFFSSQ